MDGDSRYFRCLPRWLREVSRCRPAKGFITAQGTNITSISKALSPMRLQRVSSWRCTTNRADMGVTTIGRIVVATVKGIAMAIVKGIAMATVKGIAMATVTGIAMPTVTGIAMAIVTGIAMAIVTSGLMSVRTFPSGIRRAFVTTTATIVDVIPAIAAGSRVTTYHAGGYHDITDPVPAHFLSAPRNFAWARCRLTGNGGRAGPWAVRQVESIHALVYLPSSRTKWWIPRTRVVSRHPAIREHPKNPPSPPRRVSGKRTVSSITRRAKAQRTTPFLLTFLVLDSA